MNTVKTVWEMVNYEVWGNEEDGYDVNQAHIFDYHYDLELKKHKHNSGKISQFFSAYPEDDQIKEAFSINCEIDLRGDDLNIYIDRKSDGYPIGEMRCISHNSLSPIRK